MRPRVVLSVLTINLLWAVLPAAVLADRKPPQQICGLAVQTMCPAATGPQRGARVLTLLIEPGISAYVEAKDEKLAEAFRRKASGLRFQKACVTGRLLDKQNDKHPARFLVTTPDDLVAAGPVAPDWPTANLYTGCDAEVAAPTVRGTPPHPSYTGEAMGHHISGMALIEAVVGVDGTVENARLLKSVDNKYGLDDEALQCARAWKFNPATLNGVPVRYLVTIELSFKV